VGPTFRNDSDWKKTESASVITCALSAMDERMRRASVNGVVNLIMVKSFRYGTKMGE